MAPNGDNPALERYFSMLGQETMKICDELQGFLQQLGPNYDQFKIDFIKRAEYQLMSSFKSFEMKLRMNKMSNDSQSKNNMDFLLMPPPNMQMNTPMVLAGGRMGRATKSNATPFLLHNSCDNVMDFDMDCDSANCNFGLSKTIDSGTNTAGSNINTDKVVFRTNGVHTQNNVMNGYSGAIVNGLSNAKNDSTSTAETAKNHGVQSNGANGRENTRNLNNTMNATNRYTGSANGLSGTANSIDTSNGGYFVAENPRSDASNKHKNVNEVAPTITNGSFFVANRFDGTTNQSSAANNIFGGSHGSTNSHQSVTNDRQNPLNTNNDAFNTNVLNGMDVGSSSATNGLFGVMMNRYTNTENPSNNLRNARTNQHSNGSEKTSNESVFPRFNFNANNIGRNRTMAVEMNAFDANKQNNHATNGHRMDVYNNGFDDNENDSIDSDDDEQDTNFDQGDVTDNLKAANMGNLFKTAPSALNSREFVMGNNQPNDIPNSAEMHRKLSAPKRSKREWMCYHCKEERRGNIRDFIFSTVDEVYDHWKYEHSSKNVDDAVGGAAKRKPFRFYSVDLLFCHIDSCGYFSTFQGLRRHHQIEHPKHLFVAIMNDRCALCCARYSDDGLHGHKCSSLQNGMQLKLYNPVLLTDEDVANLQAIECEEHKRNRPKHIKCKLCECGVFESRHEMTQHHHQLHGSKTINYEYIDADVKPVVAIICNCCNTEVQPKKYVDHLKFMAKQNWRNGAIPPTWDGWYRRFEMQFLKSKVVFRNGLVLFKQNLKCTDLGNHAGFTELAKGIFSSLPKNITIKKDSDN